jgi:hypothetical protein
MISLTATISRPDEIFGMDRGIWRRDEVLAKDRVCCGGGFDLREIG